MAEEDRGLTARQYRMYLLVGILTGVIPVVAGTSTPWLLIFPFLIVTIATTGRVVAVKAAQRRRELE